MRRRVALSAAWAVSMALAACDSGPSGPGARTAVVSGAAVAAVVLELSAPGIVGFDAEGGAQIFSGLVSQIEGKHRVIVVSPTAGDLRFEVQVSELDAPIPTVRVIEAVGADNRAVSTTTLQVRFDP